MNVDATFTLPIGSLALLVSSNFPPLTYNLDDTAFHNFPIEHDGSLSRQDHFFGDDIAFNQGVWSSVLDLFNGNDNVTLEIGGKAHLARVQTEAARDPQFTYTPRQLVIANGETAIYLSTMGDPVTGNAPVEYVRVFFGEHFSPPFS